MKLKTENAGRYLFYITIIVVDIFLFCANGVFNVTGEAVRDLAKLIVILFLIVFLFSSIVVKNLVKRAIDKETESGPMRWGRTIDAIKTEGFFFKTICVSLAYYTTRISMGVMMSAILFLLFEDLFQK